MGVAFASGRPRLSAALPEAPNQKSCYQGAGRTLSIVLPRTAVFIGASVADAPGQG